MYAYLAEDAYATTGLRDVEVPDRLVKPLVAAREYRDTPDHHQVSKDHLPRAVRIVHALAAAFDAAGLPLHFEPDRTEQFVVGEGRWRVTFRLMERPGSGGGRVSYYDANWSKQPLWLRRRNTKFVSTGALLIDLGYSGRGPTGTRGKFSDTKTQRLDDLLPQVVWQVEARLRHRDVEEQMEAACETLVELDWQKALDQAAVRANLANRSRVLAERATAWRLWRDEAGYLDELEARVAGDDSVNADLKAWVEWSREHLVATDPLRQAHGLPAPLPRTEEVLRPYLRWTAYLRSFS